MIVSEEICLIIYGNDLLDQVLAQISVKRANLLVDQKKLRLLDTIIPDSKYENCLV